MRKLVTGVATLVAVLALAGGASAFDCFNASRSANGNANATHSGNWVLIDVNDFVGGLVESGFWTSQQGQCVSSYWFAHGGPSNFTIAVGMAGATQAVRGKEVGNGGVIASQNPNDSVHGNGKGIDHFEDSLAPLFGAALEQCGAPEPPDED
jgi:hypothetical protein